MAAASWDGKVYFFEKSGKLLSSYGTGDFVNRVSVSQGGEHVAATSLDMNKMTGIQTRAWLASFLLLRDDPR